MATDRVGVSSKLLDRIERLAYRVGYSEGLLDGQTTGLTTHSSTYTTKRLLTNEVHDHTQRGTGVPPQDGVCRCQAAGKPATADL